MVSLLVLFQKAKHYLVHVTPGFVKASVRGPELVRSEIRVKLFLYDRPAAPI